MTAEVRAALALLTRLRVETPDPASSGAAAFGLIGGLIGLLALVPVVLLGPTLPVVGAVLALGVVAIASGGLHIDGLADTADALLAPDPVTAERARTDPAIGPGGAAALFLFLALDIASVAALVGGPGPLTAGLACVVAAAGSRAAAVALARLPRETPDNGGLGGWFAATATTSAAVLALGTAVIVAIGAGLIGRSVALPAAGLTGLAVGLAAGAWVARARGHLDGDSIGATVEITFAAIVVAAAVLAR